MSIPFEGRVHARRTAPFHVQLELTHVPADCPNDEVDIEGCVVRVFRGDALLQLGDVVSFRIWVVRNGGEPTGPAFVYYDALVMASHVEAYLRGTPPRCELAAYEFTLLHAPTSTSEMTEHDLEQTYSGVVPHAPATGRNARWWEIWKR
jgi:hypothetical protein